MRRARGGVGDRQNGGLQSCRGVKVRFREGWRGGKVTRAGWPTKMDLGAREPEDAKALSAGFSGGFSAWRPMGGYGMADG